MQFGDARAADGVARDAGGVRRRKMTMSDALKWAWSDELPKVRAGEGMGPIGAASAWGSILAYGELGSIVDRQPNRFGCIPFDDAGWPHADALLIAEAVGELANCLVDVPEGWHPMPELAAIDEGLAARAVSDALVKATVADAGGALRFRARADMLVVRHAILGLVPDWRLWSTPEKQFETWPNGRHRWFVRRSQSIVIGEHADGTDRVDVRSIEVDGWSSRLQRPLPGSYRKARFVPDPVPVMVARGEYEIFCAAMCMLTDRLVDVLASIDLVAVDWPVQPWADTLDDSGEESGSSGSRRRGPKILEDLRADPGFAAAAETATKTTAKRGRRTRKKAA